MSKKFLLLCACLVPFSVGCSKQQPIIIDKVTPAAKIEQNLDNNVNEISKEISELREEMNRGKPRTEDIIRAERGKLNPDASSVLAKKTSLVWEGEAEPVLKKIAKDLGYKFRTKGIPKGFSPNIVVRVKDVRYIDVLEEIGWQLSPYGNGLIVIERTKEIIYYKRG